MKLLSVKETVAAIRRARAVVAVSEIQRLSIEREANDTSLDAINAEIAAVRRVRRHRQLLRGSCPELG